MNTLWSGSLQSPITLALEYGRDSGGLAGAGAGASGGEAGPGQKPPSQMMLLAGNGDSFCVDF